jgi:hypothetical protein
VMASRAADHAVARWYCFSNPPRQRSHRTSDRVGLLRTTQAIRRVTRCQRPGADIIECQHNKLTDAAHREHSLREEVALAECLGMHLQKLVPGLFIAPRTGIEAVLPQDVYDHLPRALAAGQFLDLVRKKSVTPTIFTRELVHDIPQSHQGFPARTLGLSLAILVEQPSAEGPRLRGRPKRMMVVRRGNQPGEAKRNLRIGTSRQSADGRSWE